MRWLYNDSEVLNVPKKNTAIFIAISRAGLRCPGYKNDSIPTYNLRCK